MYHRPTYNSTPLRLDHCARVFLALILGEGWAGSHCPVHSSFSLHPLLSLSPSLLCVYFALPP